MSVELINQRSVVQIPPATKISFLSEVSANPATIRIDTNGHFRLEASFVAFLILQQRPESLRCMEIRVSNAISPEGMKAKGRVKSPISKSKPRKSRSCPLPKTAEKVRHRERAGKSNNFCAVYPRTQWRQRFAACKIKALLWQDREGHELTRATQPTQTTRASAPKVRINRLRTAGNPPSVRSHHAGEASAVKIPEKYWR